MKLGAKIALTPCLIVILLSCLVVQSIASSRTKSITFDEKVYITGGYHILKTGEYYFSCCHPPLIQALVASPLLLLDLKLPQIDGDLQRLDFIAQMDYSTQFFTENSDKVEEIALFSRSIIVAVSVITGLFVYAWAARLFGKKAGLFALFLYVFDPNIIAHSSIATLDLGFTALLFIGLFYLNRLIQHPNVRYFVTAGLMLGFIFLSRANAPIVMILYGIIIVIVILFKSPVWHFIETRLPHRRWVSGLSYLITLAGLLVVTSFVINVAYFFDGSFRPVSSYLDILSQRNQEDITPEKTERDARLRNTLGPILRIPVPFPNWYIQMTGFQLLHNDAENITFLAGTKGDGREFWHYYLVAFALKNTIPVVVFTILWVGMLVYRRGKGISFDEALMILAISFWVLLASISSIKLGYRLILPIVPLLYVLISRLLTYDYGRFLRPIALVFVGLGFWHMAAAFSAYPHYLAYFNESIGGPDNGYRYLVDSNLDWGQELIGLREYMEQNDLETIRFSFWGSMPPYLYGVNAEGLYYPASPDETCEPTAGALAVSATYIQLYPNCFGWLNAYEPVAKIGHSIFVYEIAQNDLPVQETQGRSSFQDDNP